MQLCLAVFVVSEFCLGRKLFLCKPEDHSSTPAERDNQGKDWGLKHRTHETALFSFGLLELETLPGVLQRVRGELHLLRELQGQAVVFFVLNS